MTVCDKGEGAKRSPLRRGMGMVGELARPQVPRLSLVLLLSLLATGFALLQPFLTKFLIDDGILGGNLRLVLVFAGVILAAAVLGALLGLLNRQLYVDASARILFALRQKVYAHLLTLSPHFFARRRTGDLMTRLDGDVAEVQRFALDSLLALVNAVILLVGSLVFMLLLSPALTLVAFLLLPAQALFLRFMRPRLAHAAGRLRERAGEIASYLVERLGGVRLIQGLGREADERALLAARQDDYRRDLLDMQRISYVTGAGPGLMMTASTAVVFVVGGAQVINGSLTLGTLIAFAAYLARASGPVQTFLGLYAASARAEVSLARVLELLDERPAVSAPDHPLDLPPTARGEVKLDAVSFGHPGRDDVLNQMSVTFPAGARIGITGASGVGKSTLVDLLQRQFDPQSGRILLDGLDIRTLSLAELRRRVVVVSQETILFNGTLAENLRLVAPGADDATLLQALERARLPLPLETPVGERGRALSGGERQRLAMARALLQEPLVILCDEALAGVDAATEGEIIAALDRLFAQATRIIISHHPRSLAGVDHLFSLQDGRLVELARP